MEYKGCMLAKDYVEWPIDGDGVGHVYVEPKYDGYRCSILVDAKQNVQFYCRDAEPPMWEKNLDHVREQIARTNLRNVMIDGEVRGRTWNATGLLKRGCGSKGYKRPSDEVMKQIRTDISVYVFDCVEMDRLKMVKHEGKRDPQLTDVRPYHQRMDELEYSLFRSSIKQNGSMVWTEPQCVTSEPELTVLMSHFIERGGCDGAMIKLPEAPYVLTRFNAWLKRKPVKTIELKVLDVGEGNGKNAGMMGQLFCVDKKGVKVSVGGGFSDALRKMIWAKRKTWPGRIIEATVEDTKVAKARCPRFFREREDRKSL